MVFNSACFLMHRAFFWIFLKLLPQDHLPAFPFSFPILLFFFYCVTKGPLKYLDKLQFAKVTYYLANEISPCDNFCGTELQKKKKTHIAKRVKINPFPPPCHFVSVDSSIWNDNTDSSVVKLSVWTDCLQSHFWKAS